MREQFHRHDTRCECGLFVENGKLTAQRSNGRLWVMVHTAIMAEEFSTVSDVNVTTMLLFVEAPPHYPKSYPVQREFSKNY